MDTNKPEIVMSKSFTYRHVVAVAMVTKEKNEYGDYIVYNKFMTAEGQIWGNADAADINAMVHVLDHKVKPWVKSLNGFSTYHLRSD